MYSLILLAVITPIFAAPNVRYSVSTPEPTKATTLVSASAGPKPTPLQIDELRRRSSIPSMPLDKRSCPYSNYYSCGDGTCCSDGTYCVGSGLCYDPSSDYSSELSSILAGYTGVDYSSILNEYSSIYNSIYENTASTVAHATTTAFGSSSTESNSNSNSNSNSINVNSSASSSSTSKKKKGTNTGVIIGVVLGVVALKAAGIFLYFFIRHNKRKKANAAAATAVQQPLMFQLPPQPQTPAPVPPTPGPSPYDAYAGKQTPYGYNMPAPPNTVEMSADQKPVVPPEQYGHPNSTQYTPPALPVAGVVEAHGESAYRPPSAATHRPYGSPAPAPPYSPPPVSGAISEMSGQSSMVSPQTTGGYGQPPPPPPPPQGMVHEMDSVNYRGV